ncbi:MAG: LemA family protein [Candidatus Paceibacterota bacterium]
MDILLYVLLGLVVLLALWVIWAYNRFIKLVNRTEEAWADIDVQLKRRYDLIPNLVSTVQGYAAHEKETFQNVTEARSQAMQAEATGDPAQTAQAENMLSGALKSLFAVAEAYPDLKANENFLELQRELSDTENKIQAARRFYNGNVRDLNTSIQSFPQNVIASTFSFSERDFFEIEEAEQRDPVKVEF